MTAMTIWIDDASDRPLTLVALRRELDLDRVPARCTVRVFAATRFRLWCNGTEVVDGPLRFHPSCPDWQEVDLAAHLRIGSNQLLALVEERRTSSYQAVDGPGGWWLSSNDDQRWDSGPGWTALRLDAWRPASAPCSFAIGPVEVCDLRALPGGWPQPSGTWPGATGRRPAWAEPAAPGLPPMAPRRHPLTLVQSCALAAQTPPSGYWQRVPGRSSGTRRLRRPSYGWFRGDGGTVRLRSFWGPHALNGVPLPEGVRHPLLGNCLEQEIRTIPGWNLIYSEVEWLADDWGLRLDVGTPIRCAPDDLAPPGFRVAAVLDEAELARRRNDGWPADAAGIAALGLDWGTSDLLPLTDCPARICAWDEPADALPPGGGWLIPAGGALAVVLDAGITRIGTLDLQGASTCDLVVDVGIDEHRRGDGLLALYASNHLINATDRFITGAGTWRVRGLARRGGRFVQITLRGTPGARVALHGAWIVSRTWELPPAPPAADPRTAALLRLGRDTVQQCLDDGWVDPWREQGFYLGDTWQAYRATRLLDPGLALALGARAVRLFAAAQLPGGGFPCVAPAWHEGEHPDFSMLWVLLLDAVCRDGGGADFARSCWPHLERLWAADIAACAGDPLRRGAARIFLDWGVRPQERSAHTCTAYNAIRVRALRASARVAVLVGRDGSDWTERADMTAATLRTACRSGDGWVAGLDPTGSPIPGSCLAARIHLAQADLLDRAELTLLSDDLLAQGRAIDDMEQDDGHADLYLLADALDALDRQGMRGQAIAIAHLHWGYMADRGAPTAWEALHRGRRGRDSLCHVWSCGQLPLLMDTSARR